MCCVAADCGGDDDADSDADSDADFMPSKHSYLPRNDVAIDLPPALYMRNNRWRVT